MRRVENFDNSKGHSIDLDGVPLAVIVCEEKGALVFGNLSGFPTGTIPAESVTGFEVVPVEHGVGIKVSLRLRSGTPFSGIIGATEDFNRANAWVKEVNKFYKK
jgi:hypothetical protein